MENYQIEAFLAVVDTGTISRAADHLYTTQSAVSKRISQLEQELGIRLFYRGKGHRNVELTSQGEQFLNICRQWQNLEKDALALRQQQERRYLSIGATELINSFTFTGFYRLLFEKYPQLAMDFHTHHSAEIYHLAASHYVDLGYVYSQQVHSELIVRPLFREKMVLLCNTDAMPGKIKEPDPGKLDPQELDPEKEVYQKWSSAYELWHDQLWPGRRYRIHVGSCNMLRGFLKEPGSWTIAPASVAQGMAAEHSGFVHRLSVEPPYATCYEIESRSPRVSREETVKVFRRDLREYLRENENLGLL